MTDSNEILHDDQSIVERKILYGGPLRVSMFVNKETILTYLLTYLRTYHASELERLKDGNIHMCFSCRSGYTFYNPTPCLKKLTFIDITLC